MAKKMLIPYFSMQRDEEEKTADVLIFGDIRSKGSALLEEFFGSPADVGAFDLVEQLHSIPEDYSITVHINSNGGEVKEGLAIYNALKNRNVTTVCEGFAASAASLIFMAGKKRVMNKASLLFIHQAIVSASGSPDDLEKAAADLRTITEAAANAYREGGVTCSDDELHQMLKAETWIKAEDALQMGFATEIDGEEAEAEGVVTNDAMASIIKAVTAKPKAPGQTDVAPLKEVVDRLNEIGESLMAAADKLSAAPKNNKGFFNFGG